MSLIKTWTNGEITIDLHPDIYERVLSKYDTFALFIDRLKYFNNDLAKNLEILNINSHYEPIHKGIYILGKDDSELGIFSQPNLALKCSIGNPFAENLKKQFYRCINLAQELETKLNDEEKKLLKVCPVYLHFESRDNRDFFKQILFMLRVKKVGELGETETGFSEEFCTCFNIPTLEEISHQPQFALHRFLDGDKHRQLLKIQATYLFKRLLSKGIGIWSLNQKNILVGFDKETGQTHYTIIDPTEDLFPPISPLYNAITSQLCA